MNAVVSHVKAYAGHLLGYLIAAATIVSAVDPKALSPTGAAVVAGAGAVVALANHSFNAGAASALLQAVTKAAGPAKLAVSFLVAGLMCLSLHACASFDAAIQKSATAVTSPQAQPFIKAGALAAVASAESHGITAAQINAVAHKALAADQGAGASLAAVRVVLDTELGKLNLPAGDLLAISLVESEFDLYIQGQLQDNPALASSQAAAADIFQAVITITGG